MAHQASPLKWFSSEWPWFCKSRALLTPFCFTGIKSEASSPLKQQAEMMEREKLRNAEGETGRRLKGTLPVVFTNLVGGYREDRARQFFGCPQAKVQEAMDTSCNKVIDIRKKSS